MGVGDDFFSPELLLNSSAVFFGFLVVCFLPSRGCRETACFCWDLCPHLRSAAGTIGDAKAL